MNKIVIIMTLISFPGFSQVSYQLDVKESQIKWASSYVLGGGHNGLIQLQSGNILTTDTRSMTNGNIVIDMTTIQSTDQQNAEGRNDLDNHLKSDDFFSTAKFPVSHFSMSNIHRAASFSTPPQFVITGLLTIKGITQKITCKPYIRFGHDQIRITGTMVIDRTRWDIIYNSASFFADLKDGIISDDIQLELDLIFSKTD